MNQDLVKYAALSTCDPTIVGWISCHIHRFTSLPLRNAIIECFINVIGLFLLFSPIESKFKRFALERILAYVFMITVYLYYDYNLDMYFDYDSINRNEEILARIFFVLGVVLMVKAYFSDIKLAIISPIYILCWSLYLSFDLFTKLNDYGYLWMIFGSAMYIMLTIKLCENKPNY